MKMRRAVHVARIGEGRFLVGKPEGKNHLEDQGVDGRIGLDWILGRFAVGMWSGFTWLRIGTVGGLL
jgi:hypothetical protein